MATLLLFGRTLLALAVVLGVVWGLSRLARRGQTRSVDARRRGARPTGARVEVLGRKSLSRGTAIAVIRVGDRNLVVATTPQSVTLISEIPTVELEPDLRPQSPATPWTATAGQSHTAWDAAISKLREHTVRR